MKIKHYNKLIRDKIPEIIKNNNQISQTKILNKSEFIEALFKKLAEEVKEIIEAKGDKKELKKEISDAYEVIDAIIKFYNLNKNSIITLQNKRKREKGAFKKQLFLLSVREKGA